MNEKLLEKKLVLQVKNLGGWAIKLLPFIIPGLPDRLCLFPGGRVIFVELKTTGEKPTKIQLYIHKKLEGLGFKVLLVDDEESLKKVF